MLIDNPTSIESSLQKQLRGLAILVLPLLAAMSIQVAYATSPGPCSKDITQPFVEADAVVLAKVVTVQKTRWTPETATDPTIVTLDVKRYWKLAGGEDPATIRTWSKTFFTEGGLYLLYLNRDTSGSKFYRMARCAPSARLSGDEDTAIDTILLLNRQEDHYVR
jgi:hypothetical protein